MPNMQTTRRALVKGAAWSVPAVALATAAPAVAATGSVILQPGTGCKLPGASCKPYRKGYLFQFQAQSSFPQGCDVTITSGTISIISGTGPSDGLKVATPITIRPGSTTVYVNGTSSDSANLTFTAALTLTGVDCDGQPVQIQTTAVVASTEPCPTCPDGSSNTDALRSAAEETEAPAETTETAVEETAATETATEATPAPAVDETPAGTDSDAVTGSPQP